MLIGFGISGAPRGVAVGMTDGTPAEVGVGAFVCAGTIANGTDGTVAWDCGVSAWLVCVALMPSRTLAAEGAMAGSCGVTFHGA